MKKTLLFLSFTVLFSLQSYSQVFWDEIPTGVSVQLSSVSNINGQIAWSCGQQGTVIRTTNNGYNWQNASVVGIPNTTILINIYAIDANTAITAGYVGANTFVYRTTDGGLTWTQVFTQANGFINVVWMNSPTLGYMQGDPVGGRWSLWRTTNGGITWDSTGLFLAQVGGEAGWNNSFWAFNNNYWFGTNSTKIYFSSNSGTNWTAQPTTPELNTYNVNFDTLGNGFAGGTALVGTTNSGQNWSAVTLPGSGNIFGISRLRFTTQNWAWVARGNSVYFSNTGGSSWSTQYTSSAGSYSHLARHRGNPSFTGPGFMYATKSNGGISRANMLVEGVTIISNEIPQTFKVSQNYPNPFNPTTKITFDLAKIPSYSASDVRGAFVSLKVYNTLGKEVAVLHDKIIQPGSYVADWDASLMPSGMYFYSFVVSDPGSNAIIYKQSKKMILVK